MVRRFYNVHAPGEVRLFTVPERGIRRWDAQVIVYDVRVGVDLVLRHYSFGDRWFEVNCSLDLDGRFVTEAGPIPWTFNCDICTPHALAGPDACNMDLWLDVLVGPDGWSHRVIDEADFAEAIRQGWLSDAERDGARAGLAELLGLIRSGELLPFLEQICPFQRVAESERQPPMERLTLAQLPVLNQAWRRFW